MNHTIKSKVEKISMIRRTNPSLREAWSPWNSGSVPIGVSVGLSKKSFEICRRYSDAWSIMVG